jgi:hypothetical protein
MELLYYVHKRQKSGTTQCNLAKSNKVEKEHHGAKKKIKQIQT